MAALQMQAGEASCTTPLAASSASPGMTKTAGCRCAKTIHLNGGTRMLPKSVVFCLIGLLSSQGMAEGFDSGFYHARYKLTDPYAKAVDNHGDGFEDLYGVRNFREVLKGVLFRGGRTTPIMTKADATPSILCPKMGWIISVKRDSKLSSTFIPPTTTKRRKTCVVDRFVDRIIWITHKSGSPRRVCC